MSGSSTVPVCLEDEAWGLYFSALALALPSSAHAQGRRSFDVSPPPVVAEIIRHSPALSKAMELLRNDSIEAIVRQREVYSGLLSFVKVLGLHHSTSPLVFTEQVIYPRQEQLPCPAEVPPRTVGPVTRSRSSARSSRASRSEKQRQAVTGQIMLNVVATLATQCNHFLKSIREQAASLEEFKDDDGMMMISFCDRICSLHAALEDSQKDGKRFTTPGQTRTGTGNVGEARESFKEWHRQNAVIDLPDGQVLQRHWFQQSIYNEPLLETRMGRMKKLAVQVSNLKTSLPEGIFVRHCNSRLDVIKVLIVGPLGTPYENGLFEFDLSCPPTWPQDPPQMFFRTTGQQQVRFNPNLYSNGHVCLSLLGTWSGQSWSPAHSTLLQLLVSIQAMIFTENPWYNEPGLEHTRNKAESDRYNEQIRQYTVELAILDWLKTRLTKATRPHSITRVMRSTQMILPSFNQMQVPAVTSTPSPHSHKELAAGDDLETNASTSTAPDPLSTGDDVVWGEVIRRHFEANGKAILERAKKWKGNKGGASHMGRLSAELESELRMHGFLP